MTNVIASPTLKVVEPNDPQLLEAVKLALTFWNESPIYGGMTKDVDRMIAFGYNARESDTDYCKVAVSDDTVIGFFVGSVAPLDFHDSLFAYDRMLYVKPDRRGGIAASKLIKSFEQWCSTRNVHHILLGVTTGIHTERTTKLYNRLGYTTVGALTMKEL